MKRNLLITAAVLVAMFFINSKASAQTTVSTGTTTATIKLVDGYSILVNDANVEIAYNVQSDYVNNRNVNMPGHLTVFSNRKYKIDVKVGDDFKDVAVPLSSIASNVMKVGVYLPGSAPVGTTYTSQFLTQSPLKIIDGAPAALAESYGINYSIPLVAPILGTPAGNYSTIVTYTLTQQ